MNSTRIIPVKITFSNISVIIFYQKLIAYKSGFKMLIWKYY